MPLLWVEERSRREEHPSNTPTALSLPHRPHSGFLSCPQDRLAGPHPGPGFPSADQHSGECVLAPWFKGRAEPAPGWVLCLPPAAGDERGALGCREGTAG